MKTILKKITNIQSLGQSYDIVLLVFRILLSAELMYAHGLKKLGVGVAEVEQIPNPLHLPETLNNLFATSANLFFPILVMLGFLTRLSVLPILAVTLTGYFFLHFQDVPLIKDTPFMYSLSYLLILFLGAGKYSIDNYLFNKFSK